MSGDAVAKQQLREKLLRRRRQRSDQEREAAGAALAAHASAEPLLARARRVAAYVSMPAEPSTAALIDVFVSSGREVVVPVVVGDHQLDWVLVAPGSELRESALGFCEPDGPRLGPSALAGCDVVLVPALAADHAGHRLGRGAGYYDRALTDVPAPVIAVVFTDELLPDVPSEPHDIPVDAVLTPNGLFRVP